MVLHVRVDAGEDGGGPFWDVFSTLLLYTGTSTSTSTSTININININHDIRILQ